MKTDDAPSLLLNMPPPADVPPAVQSRLLRAMLAARAEAHEATRTEASIRAIWQPVSVEERNFRTILRRVYLASLRAERRHSLRLWRWWSAAGACCIITAASGWLYCREPAPVPRRGPQESPALKAIVQRTVLERVDHRPGCNMKDGGDCCCHDSSCHVLYNDSLRVEDTDNTVLHINVPNRVIIDITDDVI